MLERALSAEVVEPVKPIDWQIWETAILAMVGWKRLGEGSFMAILFWSCKELQRYEVSRMKKINKPR